jgi:long-chain acyl-CoA synthetase
MVLLPRFEAKAAVREIEKRRVTALVGVPAMFGAICDCPGATRGAFRSVRGAFSGGATLSPELQSRFRALTGRPLANCYGLTEAAPAVTGEPPSRVAEKPGSIGLPLPGTVISVLDRETLTPLPVGQIGELAIKGPQVMSGYWNAPDETAEVIKDGWLLTGDLARLDTDGFAYLVGLSKRMINVSGFKVYPQEVEAVLCAHPRIRAAVVTGVADGCRGEAVMASIALVDGAALTRHEVLRYCRAQLASYKAPKIVEIVRGSGTAPKESGP